MGRLARGCVALLAFASLAHANGRPPGTSTIQFRRGHDADVVGGMTFGLVISHDGGTTWQWMCEKAIGYGGTYDPHYVYTASGALFATTFDGLKVNRSTCVFDATMLGTKFVSAVTQGPDGAIYAAVSDPTDAAIYKSTDDGMTFSAVASPGMINDWWETIAVAPSDPNRVYLSGYRFDAMAGRVFTLFRSDNGGSTFSPLPVAEFTTTSTSAIDIAGISATNPDVVFARVTFVTGNVSDAIYRSSDGGQTFSKVFEVADSLNSFVVRGNGDIVAGTPTLGFFRSTDGGMTFPPITATPVIHSSCLAESAAGVLWSCAQNFGSEAMGMAASSDALTWTSKLRYQDIQQPVACAPGTDQFDTCQSMIWCTLSAQLGITSQVVSCGALADGKPPADAAANPPAKSGCCDAGPGAPGAALGGIAIWLVLSQRRSRRSPRRDAV